MKKATLELLLDLVCDKHDAVKSRTCLLSAPFYVEKFEAERKAQMLELQEIMCELIDAINEVEETK